ncbi:hypothetical protein [Rufibacter roseolus]|uniref:hypothetical protein n=1 Tax=Rufibacter roseolus TaxID=2817375 RepID=UPI001B30041D|nr:hypothetical protein [Rufibacter roseolus]
MTFHPKYRKTWLKSPDKGKKWLRRKEGGAPAGSHSLARPQDENLTQMPFTSTEE